MIDDAAREKAIRSLQAASLIFGEIIDYQSASRIVDQLISENSDQAISKGTLLREEFRSLRPSEFPKRKFNIITEIKKLPCYP
jgi:hypothetical protein